MSGLGLTYLAHEQRIDEAIPLFQEALNNAERFGDIELKLAASEGLGFAYALQGNYQPAIDLLRSNVTLASQNQGLFDLSVHAYALNNLGFVHFLAGDLPQAETALREAIALWESQRLIPAWDDLLATDSLKTSIFEVQALTYATLQKVAVLQEDFETALEISERGRARATIDLLTQTLSLGTATRSLGDPPNIDAIRAVAAAQNATLVEYSLIDTSPRFGVPSNVKATELLTWVVDPSGKITFRSTQVDAETPIAALVADARRELGIADINPLEGRGVLAVPLSGEHTDTNSFPALQDLHQVLIEPIADLLPSSPDRRIIFIAQGPLLQVPFAALQDSDGKYFIEDHTILATPSIQTLQSIGEKRDRAASFDTANALIVGNPAMPKPLHWLASQDTVLSPLDGAETEAHEIASLLGVDYLTQESATETAVVDSLPQASIIHFATHGVFRENRGLDSAIAFAASDINDGWLTAEDIIQMDLSAELAVLSACDTGRGEVLTGEGIQGLSRAFIGAGVPSTIVSLWAVRDEPTAQLMKQFYQNWQIEKLDKAAALRQAMLALLAERPHPANWAAFVLLGEAE